MNNTIQQIITFLLISIPLALEAFSDRYRTVVKRLVDNHKADVYIRVLIIGAISYLNYLFFDKAIVKTAFLALTWFWLLFDYLYNTLTDRAFFFLGTSSWWDRKLRELPVLLVLFTKVWMFLLGIGVYYYWDRITNNWQAHF